MSSSADQSSEHYTPTTYLDHHISSTVVARHSTRVFLPDEVPAKELHECLSLAQHAPSNSNLQPWRVTIVQGAALKRLGAALEKTARDGVPSTVKPIPVEYKHYRSEMGHALYGEDGYNVPRENKQELEETRLRNYRFFDAPCALVLCIDSKLDSIDVLSAGLWLQSLVLLLQERKIGTCISVSVAGYPQVLKEHLDIPEHHDVLCGMAIGFEDVSGHVNSLKMPRDTYKESVRFISD